MIDGLIGDWNTNLGFYTFVLDLQGTVATFDRDFYPLSHNRNIGLWKKRKMLLNFAHLHTSAVEWFCNCLVREKSRIFASRALMIFKLMIIFVVSVHLMIMQTVQSLHIKLKEKIYASNMNNICKNAIAFLDYTAW